VKAFRDILAFMGDRPLSRPLDLAAEMLSTVRRGRSREEADFSILRLLLFTSSLLPLRLPQAQSVPELRDEIFLQLCKQLTGNPSVGSTERGWVLLHVALCSFPPSEELENFLEVRAEVDRVL
jgi:hypothetical protein